MKYLMIFTFLFLLSCTKDSSRINTDPSVSNLSQNDTKMEDKWTQILSYMEPSLEIDYKKDFLIANVPDDLLKAKPSDLEVRLLRIGGAANKVEMKEQYGMVKAQLIEWLSENPNDQYASTIQDVSLRYIRHLFLEENSTASNQEIEFLLETLIDLQAEDLDVLADAYEISKEPADKFKYLMYGKDLERRSKSCFHANELLNFTIQN